MTNKALKEVKESIFYPYNLYEVFCRDAVDYHAMTGEHTEVLGQFIDRTGIDPDALKDILIIGLLRRQIDTEKNKRKLL